jgi:hypothetical protein
MVMLSEQTVIDFYAEAVYDIFGKRIDSNAVYWHEYLHGNPEDRVRKVYEEMGQIMSCINTL